MNQILKFLFSFPFLFLALAQSPIGLRAYDLAHWETKLWEQILAIADSEFKAEVKKSGGRLENYKDWAPVLERSLSRLARESGIDRDKLQLAVISDSKINAYSFSGGQILLTTAILDAIDLEIQRKGSKGLDRELWINAVLAHELGHIKHRHAFRNALARIDDPSHALDAKEIQKEEVEADITAILLLQKLDQNLAGFQALMQFLNGIRQSELKEKRKLNPYLQTHPSPHERLVQVGLDETGSEELSMKLEFVFADIQLGRNLPNAYKTLQEVRNQFPENIELQCAEAVLLHKLWLDTASLEELQFKAIVDLPSFQDSMLFSKEGKKSATKKIPGDKAKFYKAVTAYRSVLESEVEPWFLSNFSALLGYSDKEKDEKEAITIAERAFALDRSVQTTNNLAVVYMIVGGKSNFEKGKEILESFWKKTQSSKEEDREVVLLNLSLALESKVKAELYLSSFDKESEWAVFLGKRFQIESPSETKQGTWAVDEIRIGSTLKDLLGKWGEPERKPKIQHQMEVWFYDSKSTRFSLKNGIVEEIFLYGKNSPALEGVQIGGKRALVEKQLGKNYKTRNAYTIYEKKEKLGILWEKDRVDQVVVFH